MARQPPMTPTKKKPSFARALRAVRVARGVPQEAFHPVSGRTYISALERGLKQPTVTKVESLAAVLDVHPLTLLLLAYCPTLSLKEARGLMTRVEAEVIGLGALEEA